MTQLRKKCVELSLAGLRPSEIAEELDCAVATVHAAKNEARAQGMALPKVKLGPAVANPGLLVCFPTHVADALVHPAGRRGMSVENLVKTMISRVLSDGLIDAVLDDGVNTDD